MQAMKCVGPGVGHRGLGTGDVDGSKCSFSCFYPLDSLAMGTCGRSYFPK